MQEIQDNGINYEIFDIQLMNQLYLFNTSYEEMMEQFSNKRSKYEIIIANVLKENIILIFTNLSKFTINI